MQNDTENKLRSLEILCSVFIHETSHISTILNFGTLLNILKLSFYKREISCLIFFHAAFFESKRNRSVFGFVEVNSTLPPKIYIVSQSPEDVFITTRAPLDPTFEQIITVVLPDQVKCITLSASMRMSNVETGHKGNFLLCLFMGEHLFENQS